MSMFSGIKVAEPDITTSTVVGISCAIIVVLFMVQPFGTSKLGSIFAPVVILWLTFNFAFGIYVGSPLCRHRPCIILTLFLEFGTIRPYRPESLLAALCHQLLPAQQD